MKRIYFARTKKAAKRRQTEFHNKGFKAKIEKASKQIRAIDGSRYVIVRKGKR